MSARWHGSVCTITQSAFDDLWGTVWEIATSGLDNLDGFVIFLETQLKYLLEVITFLLEVLRRVFFFLVQ